MVRKLEEAVIFREGVGWLFRVGASHCWWQNSFLIVTMRSKNVQREKCQSESPHTFQKDSLLTPWVAWWIFHLSPEWETAGPALGDNHTQPPESESHWVVSPALQW